MIHENSLRLVSADRRKDQTVTRGNDASRYSVPEPSMLVYIEREITGPVAQKDRAAVS